MSRSASLVASLAAFAEFAKSGYPRHRLSWVLLTAGETGRHDAIAAAIKEMGAKPRFALVVTGSSGDFSLGNRGRLDVEVIIEGRPSHSSTPWKGIDVTRGSRTNPPESIAYQRAIAEASGARTCLMDLHVDSYTSGRRPIQFSLSCPACLRAGECCREKRRKPSCSGVKEMLTVEPPLPDRVTAGSFMSPCSAWRRDSEMLVEIAAALKSQT